jgi:hypothetical protein
VANPHVLEGSQKHRLVDVLLKILSKINPWYLKQRCGAEIKLPRGAGADITNCGSGSFIFIKDLKKFYRKKSWLLKKVL